MAKVTLPILKTQRTTIFLSMLVMGAGFFVSSVALAEENKTNTNTNTSKANTTKTTKSSAPSTQNVGAAYSNQTSSTFKKTGVPAGYPSRALEPPIQYANDKESTKRKELVSQYYGTLREKTETRRHDGQDWTAGGHSQGTAPVLAPFAGVAQLTHKGGYGNYVGVTTSLNGKPFFFGSAHMAPNSATALKRGAYTPVQAGAKLGFMGCTANLDSCVYTTKRGETKTMAVHGHLEIGVDSSVAHSNIMIGAKTTNIIAGQYSGGSSSSQLANRIRLIDPTPFWNRDVAFGSLVTSRYAKGTTQYCYFNKLYGTELPVGAGMAAGLSYINRCNALPQLPQTILNNPTFVAARAKAEAAGNGAALTPEELAALNQSLGAAGDMSASAGYNIDGQVISQSILASYFLNTDGEDDFMKIPSSTIGDSNASNRSPKENIYQIGTARYGNAAWIQAIADASSKALLTEYAVMTAQENFLRQQNLRMQQRVEMLLAAYMQAKMYRQNKKIEQIQVHAKASTIPMMIEGKLEKSGDEYNIISGSSSECVPQTHGDSSNSSTNTGGMAKPSDDYIAIGDSIAVGANNGKKADNRAVGGTRTDGVLKFIKNNASMIKGQNIVLSTGATNDAAGNGVNYSNIEKQFQALKDAGVAKVVVLPVASNLTLNNKKHPSAQEINGKIAELAGKYGFTMGGSWQAYAEGSQKYHGTVAAYSASIKAGGLTGKPTDKPVAVSNTGANSTTGSNSAPVTSNSNAHLVFGDSNAVGVMRQVGGVNTQGLQGFLGAAVGGADTEEILEYIQNAANLGHVRGRKVILSPGATNDVINMRVNTTGHRKMFNQTLANIEKQLQALKNGGATEIVVMSMANNWTDKGTGGQYSGKYSLSDGLTTVKMNDELESLAKKYGAKFVRWNADLKTDHVHNYSGFKAALGNVGVSKVELIEGARQFKTGNAEAREANRRAAAKKEIKQATGASSTGSNSPVGQTHSYNCAPPSTFQITSCAAVKPKPFAGFGDEIDAYIKEAAQRYGVDESTLRGFVKMEAGWTNAKSPTGAIGVGQFTQGAWNDLVKTSEGRAIGMTPITSANKRTKNDPRYNKRVNTLATALLMKINRAMLKKNGIEPTPENLYMAHNMGAGFVLAIHGKMPFTSSTRRDMNVNGGRGMTPQQFIAYQQGRFCQHKADANQ